MCRELCCFWKKGLFFEIFYMCCVLFRLWNFTSKNKKMCRELCHFWKKEDLFSDFFRCAVCSAVLKMLHQTINNVLWAVPFSKKRFIFRNFMMLCAVLFLKKKKVYFPKFLTCVVCCSVYEISYQKIKRCVLNCAVFERKRVYFSKVFWRCRVQCRF